MKILSERNKVFQVMVWLLLILPLSAATLCRPGHQFWNETLEKCMDCSKCPEIGHVVLRRCEIHQDTVCGPLSALDIDWSFLNKAPRGHSSSSEKNARKHHIFDDVQLLKSSETEEDDKASSEEVDSSEDAEHFVTHRTSVFSNENVDKRRNKKTHNKKSYGEYSRKRLKHHQHQQRPGKHNHNKTEVHHHQTLEWSSSEYHSFEIPDRTNSSEFEEDHAFSSSSSFERHNSTSSSSRKSKHSRHHDHHSHPHSKHSNTSVTHKHKHKLKPMQDQSVMTPESASQLKDFESAINLTDVIRIENSSVIQQHSHKSAMSSSVSSAPFSAAEELIWDWQAVALALAVFACLLFFLVACVYSVHHARQWRRLKDNFEDFEADVGELSTRLSLLLPALHSEGGDACTDDVRPECCTNPTQCLYLEKLLARKHQEEEGGGCGNVYIDRDIANVHRR